MHPCHRRDDFFVRNGLPVAVRSTFLKIMSIAHFWPLQIVALVAVAWTILHLPRLASQKCAWHGRKTYIFKKNAHVINFKNLHIHPLGCNKCLWRDSRAYSSAPHPRPLPSLSLKLLHDLGLLGQASLKHQGHLRFVKQDHCWSSFTHSNHESHPSIWKTTLF